jgi:hypothetical protein
MEEVQGQGAGIQVGGEVTNPLLRGLEQDVQDGQSKGRARDGKSEELWDGATPPQHSSEGRGTQETGKSWASKGDRR